MNASIIPPGRVDEFTASVPSDLLIDKPIQRITSEGPITFITPHFDGGGFDYDARGDVSGVPETLLNALRSLDPVLVRSTYRFRQGQ